MSADTNMRDNPLSVLHVCSIKGRGGTGYMAGHICRLLKEAGHNVIVGCCPESKVEERAREQGVACLQGLNLKRGFHPLSLWQDVAKIRRCIRDHQITIVHAWHSIEYWTCALAVSGTGAKLARTRGLITPIRSHYFNRLIHNRTAALFVTCKKIRRIYEDAGFAMNNVFAIVDGVDTEKFKPGRDRMKFRQELGIAENTPLLVNVGRLQPVKGHSTFLQAMAKLPDEVQAVIAGDGWLSDELRGEWEELGLTKRVHFLGVRNDIPDILAAGDAFVLCSIGSEGSSRATLEAMAAGIPVITTTIGMLPDIVKPGNTGLMFPPKGTGELVECAQNLLNDASLRRRLSERARAFVEEHHSEAAMIERIIEVYSGIIGQLPEHVPACKL